MGSENLNFRSGMIYSLSYIGSLPEAFYCKMIMVQVTRTATQSN